MPVTPTMILREQARLPISSLRPAELAAIKKQLTLRIKPFGADKTKAAEVVEQFAVDAAEGHLLVPTAFAEHRFPDWHVRDERSDGFPISCPQRPDPGALATVEEQDAQRQFMADMLAGARHYSSVLCEAPTGSGKTVVACNTIAELGRTALVVVTKSDIADQWVAELQRHLGLAPDEIGRIQGDVAKWQGKKVVVAVVNTVAMHEFPIDCLRYFGTFICDEAHRFGASMFSRAMRKFHARHKIALTATPDRRDGRAPVFLNEFGEVGVVSTAKAEPLRVYAVNVSGGILPKFEASRTAVVSQLVRRVKRNNFIVHTIGRMHRHMPEGFSALVIGERIPHLQMLRKRCAAEEGIPLERMALYVGKEYTGETRLVPVTGACITRESVIAAGDTVFLHPDQEAGNTPWFVVSESEQGVVLSDGRRLNERQLLAPRDALMWKAAVLREQSKAVSKVALADIRDNPAWRIIFATYGMMKEAVNIRRLCCGIEATPTSDGIQVPGRIRRPMEGKPATYWFTLVDYQIQSLHRLYTSRLRGYLGGNATVVTYNQQV